MEFVDSNSATNFRRMCAHPRENILYVSFQSVFYILCPRRHEVHRRLFVAGCRDCEINKGQSYKVLEKCERVSSGVAGKERYPVL